MELSALWWLCESATVGPIEAHVGAVSGTVNLIILISTRVTPNSGDFFIQDLATSETEIAYFDLRNGED